MQSNCALIVVSSLAAVLLLMAQASGRVDGAGMGIAASNSSTIPPSKQRNITASTHSCPA
jgi:hypothetical protein